VPTPSLLLPNAEQEKAMVETAQELNRARENLAMAVRQADSGFREWLATASASGNTPGLVAHFSFDELAGTNQFANLIAPTNLSPALQGNPMVQGKGGQAIRYNGEDKISFPTLLGLLDPGEQYSLNFWVEVPAALTNVTIFHRCEGTDTGFHGTELGL